jgi:hypothetical protein
VRWATPSRHTGGEAHARIFICKKTLRAQAGAQKLEVAHRGHLQAGHRSRPPPHASARARRQRLQRRASTAAGQSNIMPSRRTLKSPMCLSQEAVDTVKNPNQKTLFLRGWGVAFCWDIMHEAQKSAFHYALSYRSTARNEDCF